MAKKESFPVSYRDKATNQNVSLGEIELVIPETVEEASAQFGVEDLLDYAVKAYVIDKQREHRDANRPDKPKSTSNVAKFKQLTPEAQEAALKAAGILQ